MCYVEILYKVTTKCNFLNAKSACFNFYSLVVQNKHNIYIYIMYIVYPNQMKIKTNTGIARNFS